MNEQNELETGIAGLLKRLNELIVANFWAEQMEHNDRGES